MTPASVAAVDPTLPILYSFRRCPYAMRARLALAASGQACELREVVLRSKPDRKSTRLNSSHIQKSRMPSSA